MRLWIFILSLILISSSLFGQQKLSISKIESAVNIDGILDEEFWSKAESTTPFLNQWPQDTGLAKLQTVIKMVFDEDYIYVGIICHDDSRDNIIQTLKRDKANEYFGSDGIGIVLDPYHNKNSGFFFGVNAAGAQIEGLVSLSGTASLLDENWDNKWFSQISHGDKTWYVEMAIPFRTLRFNIANRAWGLNFVRNDMKNNYYTSWNHVPVNQNTISLGHIGELIWQDSPPGRKNGNFNLLPYVVSKITKDYELTEDLITNVQIGLDAKVAVTSALNLDLTVNPDFSTIDVDRQTTNLTRFPLFFPERRSFFLENSDLFNSFGISTINPFFSRRIGLNEGRAVPILFGAKLSGQLQKKIRFGLLDVQTGRLDDLNPQNYLVTSMSKTLGQKSTIDGMLINRQTTGKNELSNENSYNRVFALEYNFRSNNSQWSANAGWHKSINPGELKEEAYYKASIQYNNPKFRARFSGHRVGTNYITDVGFVPRLTNFDAAFNRAIRIGFYQFSNLFVYNIFPSHSERTINLHGPRISSTVNLNLDGSFNSSFLGAFYYFNFKNQSEFEIGTFQNREILPFDSYIVGNIPFKKDEYSYGRYGVWYRFDPRNKVSGSFSAYYGTFYNGKRVSFDPEINYRIQPWGKFSINYEYNNISLPVELESTTLHLIGAKSEISFSNKMSWTTFLQYNMQANNLNINSRFQWRYAPMSDLFIVYSENYNAQSFDIQNRGLVLKITYWI